MFIEDQQRVNCVKRITHELRCPMADYRYIAYEGKMA